VRLPKDRNDRVLLGKASALVGLGLAIGLSNTTDNPDIFKDHDPAKSAKSMSH
jgi:hypothetical protein